MMENNVSARLIDISKMGLNSGDIVVQITFSLIDMSVNTTRDPAEGAHFLIGVYLDGSDLIVVLIFSP